MMKIFGKNTVLFLLVLFTAGNIFAGSRFTSGYPCTNGVKTCVSSGIREIEGERVHRDCWEWAYTKSCNYPSQDNCRAYAHCYFVANGRCFLRDSQGNCVNQEREFSCKSHEPVTIEARGVRTGLKEREGAKRMVCSGIPCLDGNCVDKSYVTNGEMFDSLSRLHAAGKMSPDKHGNFNLFQGTPGQCSKKAAQYSNCCKADPRGWGEHLGARCTRDERDLAEKRSRNLCVYVGKSSSRTLGATMVVKHHFCCWSNMLDKVIQVQGRKQLGIGFGSSGSPNCRGLTMAEIQRLDFSRMDFSEFIEDFKLKFAGKYKAPNPAELGRKIQDSTSGIRKYDKNPGNPKNNMSGWNERLEEAEEGR